MHNHREVAAVVVVEDDKMIGIVSLGDLVKHMLQEKEAEVEQLAA